MSQRPKVSVCIPTYNRRQILLQTLESFKRQEEPVQNFEVVVGDDGSFDGTVEMVSALQTPYRLRVFTHANAGPAAATNLAATHAEAQVLAPLDRVQSPTPPL